MIRIGTSYGGWWVPSDGFNSDSVCYCAGVGTDVSFDIGLIDRFGCNVWGIDPTPKSLDWARSQDLDPAFTLVPVGLAGSSGMQRFYAPENPKHVSHSITNLQRTKAFFEAQCLTVLDLRVRLGHERIDLLKLDIEGAQHDVITSLLRDGVIPSILCVEFDQPEALTKTRSTVRLLQNVGYNVARVDGFNVTFTRQPG